MADDSSKKAKKVRRAMLLDQRSARASLKTSALNRALASHHVCRRRRPRRRRKKRRRRSARPTTMRPRHRPKRSRQTSPRSRLAASLLVSPPRKPPSRWRALTSAAASSSAVAPLPTRRFCLSRSSARNTPSLARATMSLTRCRSSPMHRGSQSCRLRVSHSLVSLACFRRHRLSWPLSCVRWH
jgi:hypothetical protein